MLEGEECWIKKRIKKKEGRNRRRRVREEWGKGMLLDDKKHFAIRPHWENEIVIWTRSSVLGPGFWILLLIAVLSLTLGVWIEQLLWADGKVQWQRYLLFVVSFLCDRHEAEALAGSSRPSSSQQSSESNTLIPTEPMKDQKPRDIEALAQDEELDRQ